MKITEGQWLVSEAISTVPNNLTIMADDTYIAELFSEGEEVCQATKEECEANARLIASAPKLLKASQELMNCLNMDSDGDYFICKEAKQEVDNMNKIIEELEV